MSYIGNIVECQGYCPAAIAVQDYTRAELTNKALYQLLIFRKLAVHVKIIADVPRYAVRLGHAKNIPIPEMQPMSITNHDVTGESRKHGRDSYVWMWKGREQGFCGTLI